MRSHSSASTSYPISTRLRTINQLPFAPTGITILFGDNGSGKTGFAGYSGHCAGHESDPMEFCQTSM